MKNILFLEQFANIGGAQNVLLDLLSGLDRSKYHSIVGVPGKGPLIKELDERDIPHFDFPLAYYSPGEKKTDDIIRYTGQIIYLVPKCLSIIKKNKIDLIYANAPRAFTIAVLAGKISGKPVILHLHLNLGGWERWLCRQFLLLKNVTMVAVSRSVKERLVLSGDKLADKIKVVNNGIDEKRFVPGNADSARREFNVPNNIPLIGYVGRISKGKGLEDLINTAEELIKLGLQARMIIVGEELFGSRKTSYKQELLATIKERRLDQNFIFTGTRKDIPSLLAAFDLLVVPSRIPEAFPMVVLEGMAAGKAVIASNLGGVREIITEGFNGLLYPAGNQRILAEKIRELLSDQGKRKKMGEQARATVCQNFTLSNFINNANKVINDVFIDKI